MERPFQKLVAIVQTMAAIAVVFLLSKNWLLQFYGKRSFRISFLYTLALLFILVVCMTRKKGRPFWPKRIFETRIQFLLFIAVLTLGIGARTIYLGYFPPPDGVHSEAARQGSVALNSITAGGLDQYDPMADLVGELGLKFFSRTIYGFRIPFIIIGILSIPVFFIAARLLFKTFFAAIAATSLWASSTFLSSSQRVAAGEQAGVFWESLALAALFYACAKRNCASFAAAGFAIGLLSGAGGWAYRIVPLLALFLLLLYLFQSRKPQFPASEEVCRPSGNSSIRLSHFLLFITFALAVAIPAMLINPHDPFFIITEGLRRSTSSIGAHSTEKLPYQVIKATLFRIRQTTVQVFYTGKLPILVPDRMGVIEFYTGLLGLVSLVYCAWTARRNPLKIFLVVSIISIAVLSGALVPNPVSYRLVPIIPFYYLCIGALVDDVLSAGFGRSRALRAAITVLFIILVSINLYNFLVVTVHDPLVNEYFYNLDIVLSQTIASIQKDHPNSTIFLFSTRRYLGLDSDFHWLYDHTKVKVITSPDQISGEDCYILAHDPFIPSERSLPPLQYRTRWKTKFNKNEIFLGKVAPRPTAAPAMKSGG